MTGPVGDGNAVFKPDWFGAGIGHLQKEPAVLLIAPHRNDGGCFRSGQILTGVKGVFQRVGQQHAQIAVGDQEKGWERHRRVQGNAVPAGALRKGGEDEICRIVFTVPLYLLCLDLRADTGDIGLCPLCLPLFDTARQILQVVTQVMAVGAGLLLGLAQGIDLPDRLGHLHPQTVLKLLEPVPQPHNTEETPDRLRSRQRA